MNRSYLAPALLLSLIVFPSSVFAEDVNVPNGFVLEKLYDVPLEDEGSWVAIANGLDGQLIVSDQGDKGMFTVDVSDGEGQPKVTVEKIPVDVSAAQGLLVFQGKLYVHCNPRGFYCISDSDGDKKFDAVEKLPDSNGSGEHGPHALVPTADGDDIFILAGNHTKLPEYKRARLPSWDEDLLLTRQWDARGHARGILAPGGWVCRFDPNEKSYDVYCTGFRNQYDLDLNSDGEAFTFDADMEWDLGSPWYRPTRICHVVSGGEYGWRSGTGKSPVYYEDTLPPVVDIGPGSPTGVVSGRTAKFPAKYQQALFALDWTFGTIYAIHMTPDGSSYRGTAETFVTGVPLAVTDAVIGADGAMYFATGGRGMQSHLYRLKYTGDESVESRRPDTNEQAIASRRLRQSLELFHGREDTKAVDLAWRHAGSQDRFIRYAARLAIESQPVDSWSQRVYGEADTQRRITMAVALARAGTESHRAPLIKALNDLDLEALPESQLLGACRAYALTFIRLGRPTSGEAASVIEKLHPLWPSESEDVTRELIRLSVYLRDPSIIEKAIPLLANAQPAKVPDWAELASRSERYGSTINQMMANHPPGAELSYALSLREATAGWTMESRRTFFNFLNKAAKASGGMSYPGFLTNIRNDALALCTNDERMALQDITGENFNPVPDFEIKPLKGPGKKWTEEQAVATAQEKKRDFESGRNAFFAADCGKCHRMAGLGGGVGPDLTSVGSKFDAKYLVESVLDPSKNISDQYSSSSVILNNGKVLEGIVREADDEVVVYTSDANQEPIHIPLGDVEEVRMSKVSQMPLGLFDGMNEEELADLMAYLISGGNKEDKRFRKK